MPFPDKDYEDQAHRIVDNATVKAPPIYRMAVEHFRRLLERSGSFDTAASDLEKRAADREFMQEHRSLLLDAMTSEDALGRSYVVEKDVYFSVRGRRPVANLAVDGVQLTAYQAGWIACRDVVNISFDLTPAEVVDYLRRKAFWISGIENDEVLKAIQRRLIEAANKGHTYKQFLDDVEVYFEEMPNSRPQTVFRTNLYSAYSIGQLEQIDQMRNRFPMWRYVAILDRATRPDHAALNGKLFPTGQGPYPPIDYNCRCSAQQLHVYEVEGERLVPSEGVELPEDVRRFDTRSAFETWLAKKVGELNPGIRGQVQSDL